MWRDALPERSASNHLNDGNTHGQSYFSNYKSGGLAGGMFFIYIRLVALLSVITSPGRIGAWQSHTISGFLKSNLLTF